MILSFCLNGICSGFGQTFNFIQLLVGLFLSRVCYIFILFFINLKVPDPKEYVPMIDCMMRSPNPPTATGACLSSLGISTTTLDKVEDCSKSDEGSNLLHTIGIETKDLNPPLNYVPWMLFNNVSSYSDVNFGSNQLIQVFDEDAWQQGLDNLTAVLCKKFLAGSSKCQEFQNFQSKTNE